MAEPTHEQATELVESWRGFFLERIDSGHRRESDPRVGFDEFLADAVAFAAVSERQDASWSEESFNWIVAEVQAGFLDALAKRRQ